MANVARSNSNSPRNSSPRNDQSTNQMHFVENSAQLSVQDFLNRYVSPYKDEGADFIDFTFREGKSNNPNRADRDKVSSLTVRMPQFRVNPSTKTVEINDTVSEDGEVIPAQMVDLKIFASEAANKVLLENRKAKKGFAGLCVSAFYATDKDTKQETGLAAFTIAVKDGESVDAASLGLRI